MDGVEDRVEVASVIVGGGGTTKDFISFKLLCIVFNMFIVFTYLLYLLYLPLCFIVFIFVLHIDYYFCIYNVF